MQILMALYMYLVIKLMIGLIRLIWNILRRAVVWLAQRSRTEKSKEQTS